MKVCYWNEISYLRCWFHLIVLTDGLKTCFFHVARQIRIYLKSTTMSRQETNNNIQRVRSRMEELQISQQRKFDELSAFQFGILQKIIEKLAVHFKSEDHCQTVL